MNDDQEHFTHPGLGDNLSALVEEAKAAEKTAVEELATEGTSATAKKTKKAKEEKSETKPSTPTPVLSEVSAAAPIYAAERIRARLVR